MLTRGYFIGDIIDELSSLSAQIDMRCKLGMTDLNVISENYFKDILNIILNAQLLNLNEHRSNEPGLDLGDAIRKEAFQITSTANADKVNKTLKRLTAKQKDEYNKFRVLIIGKKQGSYSLDPASVASVGFHVSDIWDLDDLARLCMSLPLERLQALQTFIRANSVKLRIELELADDSGQYPTNGYDKWETTPTPKMGNLAAFRKFCAAAAEVNLDAIEEQELGESFRVLSRSLIRTPRITREFLAMLFERRSRTRTRRSNDSQYAFVVVEIGRRLYTGSNFLEEVSLLEHADLAYLNYEDESELGLPEVILRLSDNDDLAMNFVSFVEKNKLSYRMVLGNVDFSAF
ncbi:SMEK domain-containing protein [Caballeronia sp. dw_19]|uniref:SMEK domain-containing protein n=1 Tax=Caballeronia sp. dw_19 TaxID=2719791 RepID=UPI001BCC165E|nr:SMEK domain-containing protein [Caballeronia sp. dw_19]